MFYSIIALVGKLVLVHAIRAISTIPGVFITIAPVNRLSGTIAHNKLTLHAILQSTYYKSIVDTISIGCEHVGNLQLDGRCPIHRIFGKILNYRILLHSLGDGMIGRRRG